MWTLHSAFTHAELTIGWLIDWFCLVDWLIKICCIFQWLIDWLVGWLVDWLISWLVSWYWLVDLLVSWLIDWLMDWLIEWLVVWLVIWLDGWLIDWLVDWSIGRFVVWLVVWLTGWLADWLTYLPIDWWIDRSIDRPTDPDGRSAGRSVGRSFVRSVGRSIDRLIEGWMDGSINRSIDWLIDRWIDQPISIDQAICWLTDVIRDHHETVIPISPDMLYGAQSRGRRLRRSSVWWVHAAMKICESHNPRCRRVEVEDGQVRVRIRIEEEWTFFIVAHRAFDTHFIYRQKHFWSADHVDKDTGSDFYGDVTRSFFIKGDAINPTISSLIAVKTVAIKSCIYFFLNNILVRVILCSNWTIICVYHNVVVM